MYMNESCHTDGERRDTPRGDSHTPRETSLHYGCLGPPRSTCESCRTYEWVKSHMCLSHVIHMNVLWHASVWHDPFICNMTHPCGWHDSFICDINHSCVTSLIHMCDMTYSCEWHDPITCVTWLIHICRLISTFWFQNIYQIHME